MIRTDPPRQKKAGHLTLLRQPRQLTASEFNALAFAERLEMVRQAQGRRKYELLLEAADAERLAQRLSAQELYLLARELGPEDVPELLGLVSAEQFTTFLDLDCWERDLLDAGAALRWLALLQEAGEEKAAATARGMEFELLTLLIKKLVVVTAAPGDLLEEDTLPERRLEGIYDVDYRNEESAKVVGAFLDLLFRREHDLYLRLMEAARWEEEALLEEDAFRFRSGRLLDLGFPDPVEALVVYAWLDPDTFDPAAHRKAPMGPGEAGVEAPIFALAAGRPRDLLAEVLAGGIDSETCWELTYLLNKVMSADGVDVGERAQLEESAEEVYRYLNLALEHLSEGDVRRAAEALAGLYLEHLFRLGFSLTLRLQRRAARLRDARIAPYLDGPFRALLHALGRRKPRFFEGIEDVTRAGERPFASLRDLRLAEEWLDRVEVQRRLFEERFPFDLPAPGEIDLAGCRPQSAGELTLSDFFLTALANQVLGRPFIPRPVAAEELPALHACVCAGGEVNAELRRETFHWLESQEPGAGAFGEWCLDLWQEELCALGAAEIDPRFVSGVIVRVE